jgi:hypothetical protein
MSVITANTPLSLLEATKREGYDGAVNVIAELQQQNDFVDEVAWFRATHGLYNKQLQAKRLGKGAFSKANAPVPTISSSADMIPEPVKLYEGDSPVDERVLKGVQDAYAVRDSEDAMNLEGLMQDWIYNLIYANEGDVPDAFKSLSRRRASLGDHVVWSLGGSGSDLTSMYLFEFGRSGFFLAYPQGTQPGLLNDDRGRHNIPAPTGSGNYWAWIRHYEIWAALVERNKRSLMRICNIESAGSANNFLDTTIGQGVDVFINAKNWLPKVGRNAVAFCNRTLKGQIDNAAYAKSNVYMTVREVQNYGPITFVAGIPIRLMEPLLNTESAVS